MNIEETPMGDDDRFVLQRGTQGDDWRMQDGAPKPEPPAGNLLDRLRSVIGSAGKWTRARLDGLRSIPGQRSELPPEGDASQSLVQPEEPGSGWAPVPPLPEDSRVAIPWSQVAPARPRLPSLRERFVTNRPRVAIPWSKIALGRSKIGSVKAPKVSAPKVSAPKLPPVKAPRMPKMKAPMMTFSGLAGIRLAVVRDDLKAPLAVFGGLALASLIALGAIVAIETIGGGGDGVLVIATETPKVTDAPQETPTETPVETVAPTQEPTPTEAPSATAEPETATPVPATAAPTPTLPGGGAPAPTPQGGVAVAYWSNKLSRWWFGDLTDASANYEEGQNVPFLVRWDGTAGATYWLRITYDCQVPDVFGALDYLSGVQSYGGELATAQYGPGSAGLDAAIPAPDTPNFDPDDGDSGVFKLWNAKFPILPLPPHPDDNCVMQRTLDVPIQAFGGPIIFMASGHLGSATVYSSGEGASTAAEPFGLHVTVDGVGSAAVMIDPSAVADVER
jgi:hypothetical protein